ncbi:MAG: DUF3887 domain-containing protein [Methanobacteriota archaeon]
MKKKVIVIIIIMTLSVALTGCVETPNPPEKTQDDIARELVTDLSNGNYSAAYDILDVSVQQQINITYLKDAWTALIQLYGDFEGIDNTRTAYEANYTYIFVTCSFSQLGNLDIKCVFLNNTKIVGFFFVPTEVTYEYEPPDYVNLSAFSDTNITIGTNPWLLPAILSVPHGDGPFPVVVLVHGSGPNDQDETIGPNKPFKDLAWGLASNGIVVLRYVKRTKQYPTEFTALKNFTVQDETIDDAVITVDQLTRYPMVDPNQIFVLGHSLGGMLAPRIAQEAPMLSGIIILAGNTRPLEDLFVEQTEYLGNLDGNISETEAQQIAAVQELAIQIKTLNISDGEYVLGAPRSYWADLATYDPVSTAENITIPMLIMQGLRDYQVTQADYTRWNTTFSQNPRVTLHTHPLLNHLFIEGTGVPTNTEYLTAGHVNQTVITDIITWISQVDENP